MTFSAKQMKFVAGEQAESAEEADDREGLNFAQVGLREESNM